MFRCVAVILLLVKCGSAQLSGTDSAFAQALRLQQSGDLEGAIREYREVVRANPGRFDARSNLGAVLAKLGRYQDSIQEYTEALNTAPPEAAKHLRLNLALAYYKSFQISQAADLLAKIHTEDPENLNATLLLADCHLRLGSFRKVVDLLSPVEAVLPDNRAITYLLGTALIRDGAIEAGQKRVDKILREGDSAEGRFLLGMGMYMAGDYPSAVKALRRAIDLNPNLPTLQSFYGQALLNTGDAQGASEAFQKELVANPNDFEANLRLGQILMHRGKKDEARPLLEHAVLTRPGSGEARAALDGKDTERAVDGGILAGNRAPDFELLGLAKFHDRSPVVLVFGSYTCPQFRGSAAELKKLSQRFRDRVPFRLIYIKEAHAAGQWQSTMNDRDGIDMQPARDIHEKEAHASLCVRKLDLPFPAITDGMDGKIEAAYDAWPSRVYLIAKDGRVAYNSRLGELDFKADQLESAIQTALGK